MKHARCLAAAAEKGIWRWRACGAAILDSAHLRDLSGKILSTLFIDDKVSRLKRLRRDIDKQQSIIKYRLNDSCARITTTARFRKSSSRCTDRLWCRSRVGQQRKVYGRHLVGGRRREERLHFFVELPETIDLNNELVRIARRRAKRSADLESAN